MRYINKGYYEAPWVTSRAAWDDVSLQVCLEEGYFQMFLVQSEEEQVDGCLCYRWPREQCQSLLWSVHQFTLRCNRTLDNSPAQDNPSSFYVFPALSKSIAILLLFFGGQLPRLLLGLSTQLWRSKEQQLLECKTQLRVGHSAWQLII